MTSSILDKLFLGIHDGHDAAASLVYNGRIYENEKFYSGTLDFDVCFRGFRLGARPAGLRHGAGITIQNGR